MSLSPTLPASWPLYVNLSRIFNTTYEPSIEDRNLWLRAPLTIVAGLLTLITVFGNLFVLIAIRVNQKLKRIHASILITSLAFADLLVGAVVMPLAVVEVWTGRVWIFNRTLCRIWTFMDVICCTASIATLCIISIDRYVGVARPLEYAALMTRKRLWVAVILVWSYSLAVLLACMKTSDVQLAESSRWCHVGAELNYVTYSVILSFFLPLIVILAFYYRIYRVTQNRNKSFVETRKGVIRRCSSLVVGGKSGAKENQCRQTTSSTKIDNENIAREAKSPTGVDFRKQNKAAFTLAVVVGAFVLFWLPFFVFYMIGDICVKCRVPSGIFELFTWLGYSNSSLNPLIYSLSMKTFGDTLKQIIVNRPFRGGSTFYQRPLSFVTSSEF